MGSICGNRLATNGSCEGAPVGEYVGSCAIAPLSTPSLNSAIASDCGGVKSTKDTERSLDFTTTDGTTSTLSWVLPFAAAALSSAARSFVAVEGSFPEALRYKYLKEFSCPK